MLPGRLFPSITKYALPGIEEIQRYLFKVGPTDLPDGPLHSGIVDFFEEGVAADKGVLELIGNDVAAFCDDLVKDSRTNLPTPGRVPFNGVHER